MSSLSNTFSTSSATTDGDFLVKSQFTTTHHSITSEKLHGKNYASWSTAVLIWFMGQGQEAYLEHDIATIPEADRPAWKKLDAQLLAILWQSIDPQFMTIFRTFMTCHSTWTQAKCLFQGDITRAYDIIGNLFQLKQSETNNATHIGRFQSFATEFCDLLPFTSDARAYAQKMDELLVIMYLHTIRPDLDSVKSSILGSPAIPSLTELVMAEGDPLRLVEEEHLAQAEADNLTRAVDVGARNVSIVANLGIGRTPAMILSAILHGLLHILLRPTLQKTMLAFFSFRLFRPSLHHLQVRRLQLHYLLSHLQLLLPGFWTQ
ncbi:hypothetical protein AKJ16_DCAP02955, partial [Drosera capensis]